MRDFHSWRTAQLNSWAQVDCLEINKVRNWLLSYNYSSKVSGSWRIAGGGTGTGTGRSQSASPFRRINAMPWMINNKVTSGNLALSFPLFPPSRNLSSDGRPRQYVYWTVTVRVYVRECRRRGEVRQHHPTCFFFFFFTYFFPSVLSESSSFLSIDWNLILSYTVHCNCAISIQSCFLLSRQGPRRDKRRLCNGH